MGATGLCTPRLMVTTLCGVHFPGDICFTT